MAVAWQSTLAPVAILYTGGTLGSQGVPLAPVEGARLQPAVASIFAQWNQLLHWHAWAVPLDSSQLQPVHWHQLLDDLIDLYTKDIRHVLIIHGTDTLAHTGAFLAEALSGSDLHVVLTGSQLPLLAADGAIDPASDAVDNLRTAMQALFQSRPGVRVAFAGESWPAQTVQKIHTRDHSAFSGHQRAGYPAAAYQPLSRRMRQQWLDNWQHHWPRVGPRLLHTTIHSHFFLPQPLTATHDALAAVLALKPEGLILLGHGSGNVPDTRALRDLMKQAHRQGTLVVAATQVPFGGTDARYACSQWLAQAQVLPAARLTLPAVYARLLWLCARLDTPSLRRRRWTSLLNDTRSTVRDYRHEP